MTNPIDGYRNNSGSSSAPAPRSTQPQIIQLLDSEKVKKGIAAVVGKNMSAERMTKLMVNAIHKTPALMQCDPKTVLGAFMTSAALGLEPNTPQGLAYLIPYKRRVKQGNSWVDAYDCQFQIGYKGFITLAGRCGIQIAAGAIHQGDVFDYMVGSENFLRYRVNLEGERGGLIGAFAYSKTEHGELATVLPLSELMKIRGKSETFSALERNVRNAANANDRMKAEQKLADTPWVMWEDDMASKSAIKKHAKMLPLGMALSVAAELDSQSDAGVLDLSAMADPDMAGAMINDGYVPTQAPREPETIEHQPGEPVPGSTEVPQQTAEPVRQSSSRSRSTPRASRQADAPAAEPSAPVEPAGPAGDEPPPFDDDMFNAE